MCNVLCTISQWNGSGNESGEYFSQNYTLIKYETLKWAWEIILFS